MIHASNVKPRIFPVLMDGTDVEMDRVQDLSSTVTLNRTKIQEVGRDGLVSWRTSIPSVTVNVRQLEYGNIEFYRKIANKGDSVTTISWTDLKTPIFDIAGYETDDDGTVLGTIWYPNLRSASLAVNIGDPDAIIERTFGFAGEDEIKLQNANKYLIHGRYTLAGGQDDTATIANPAAVADPDNSGRYLFKVVKVSSGTATELAHGTGWSCDGTTLTINGSSSAGDVVHVWYSAGTLGNQATFVNNDTDAGGLLAEATSIYLASSNYLYRLQSASFDISFDRRDLKEIGNKEVVSRGVRNITTRVTLGKILESYTIEEVLRGVAGQSYGKIDVRNYTDDLQLVVKCYSDNTKTSFLLGYKFTDLAPTGDDAGIPVNDYVTEGATLEGEIGFVTNDENVL